MAGDRAGWILSNRWIVALVLGLAFTAGMAFAQESSRNYAFLVASGFLCDLGHASTCPAVAKSTGGDTFEMSGAGTVNTKSKSVTAAGTFTHKSASGMVLETGVWVASELLSFDSYGIAPGELKRGAQTFGPLSSAPWVRECSPAPCQRAVWPYSAFASCLCGGNRKTRC